LRHGFGPSARRGIVSFWGLADFFDEWGGEFGAAGSL
jgi:hypothetical protein